MVEPMIAEADLRGEALELSSSAERGVGVGERLSRAEETLPRPQEERPRAVTPNPTPAALARIYRPARAATQSGTANTRHWVLEFEPAEAREIDPLMGWTSSGDMYQQVRLRFSTLEQAIAYAERHGLKYLVQGPRKRKPRLKSYADNFRYKRAER